MTIIYFIIILGITVFIHELGHFIFAKRAGIYVYEFSLGMGPQLFKFNRKNDETTYSVRLFPIGGFVQLAGETDVDENHVPEDKKLPNKSWLNRFMTIAAGIVFNFILAIILFFVIALVSGAPQTKAILSGAKEDTSAYMVGLKKGDVILEVNNVKISNIDDFMLELAAANGKSITVKVKRDYKDEAGSEKGIFVHEVEATDGIYGFLLDTTVKRGILPAIEYAFVKTGAVLKQMVTVIAYLVTQKISLDALAGPVGIYAIVDSAAKLGILNLMYLNAVISINVGFVNLLPIPAFDGGRLLFLVIEKILGRPVNHKFENIVHTIGFGLLMLMMILVTYNDIVRLFK